MRKYLYLSNMRKLVLNMIFCGFFLTITTNSYALCNHIYIQDISNDGTLIKTISGKTWEAYTYATAIGWGINDDVIMCGDGNIINHTQNERIPVFRVE